MIKCRPICEWVAESLEGTLVRNDYKPAWEFERKDQKYSKFTEELSEFLAACQDGHAHEIIHEGMDLIAAVSMYIAHYVPELKNLCRGR